jgi:SRSO17 transposase
MTKEQISDLGPALSEYLGEFDDCFISPDTRYHLEEYVKGQLSDLPKKNVQRIARLADVPPRTLQEFLSLSEWDEDRLRDTVQHVVARDHGEEQAIAIVDESGHPKKGKKTACVHRDYCGASGKIDNCVMGVHLCYASFDGRFRAMLDSDLYLPKDGWNDEDRRAEAEIPESVVYRGKNFIALEQLERAIGNGMHFGWVTADEWYGEKPNFVHGVEALGLRFVLEIPRNLMGWVREPKDVDTPRGEVQDLARWSTPMLRQEWVDFHIKDTQAGAMVWEVRAAPFWMIWEKKVVGPYWLVVARDRLNQDSVKYFLSNAPAGVPLEVIMHVAFSRWPVERTLEDEKSELGLSDFAVRKFPSVLRHLRITQVSHLFLARQAKCLAEKKSGGNDLPGTQGGRRDDRRNGPEPGGSDEAPGEGGANYPGRSERQRQGARISYQSAPEDTGGQGDLSRQPPLLHSAKAGIALWD